MFEKAAASLAVKVNLELVARDAIKAVKRRDVIVIVDVLRCSSSILNAFANGAEAVIPAETLREAYDLRRQHSEYLLAGERRGLRPSRFDLGNSPLEFTREKVCGKTLVFTTTSGTAALTRVKEAKWVLIGALLNAKSVATKAMKTAKREHTGVSLVLSGRKGHFSLEDFICAGAVVDSLSGEEVILSDASFAALLAFRQTGNNLCASIMKGEHAKHLVELGFGEDVEFACQLDLLRIAPAYRDGVIKPLEMRKT